CFSFPRRMRQVRRTNSKYFINCNKHFYPTFPSLLPDMKTNLLTSLLLQHNIQPLITNLPYMYVNTLPVKHHRRMTTKRLNDSSGIDISKMKHHHGDSRQQTRESLFDFKNSHIYRLIKRHKQSPFMCLNNDILLVWEGLAVNKKLGIGI